MKQFIYILLLTVTGIFAGCTDIDKENPYDNQLHSLQVTAVYPDGYTDHLREGVTVKSSSPMTLTLELMVNGESFSRTYTTPLTPPNNLLSAGNSYLFRAVINENSISFANVSVKEWTEVDESGNPLYPVQD